MLVGTVYFYVEAMEILKEMDLGEFHQYIQQLNTVKVTLNSFSHNHHNRKETVLYSKNKKQT